MNDHQKKIHASFADAFYQFARNGRWGTCAGCPRDSEGGIYPEFCADTERYDHKLDIVRLADTYQRQLGIPGGVKEFGGPGGSIYHELGLSDEHPTPQIPPRWR